MTDNTRENTIHLGICMAGAVSAGAYTAGVIDYLLETLEAWEEAKKHDTNENQVPTHRVLISAISGSSAGGIISVMLPKMFYTEGQPHVSLNTPAQTDDTKAQNMLYNTWVNFYLKGDQNILDELLDPSDITGKGGLHSLLNSGFKQRIAGEILENTPATRTTVPGFVEKDLDVIVGVTNTSGYTFNVPFRNNTPRGKQPAEDAYTVITHRDLAHFVVTGDYDPSSTPGHRGKIPFNPASTSKADYQPVSDAARGTSAFPIGFISEKMTRPWDIVAQNDLLFKDKASLRGKILPEELKNPGHTHDFETFNVDSGTVNNEPFEHIKTVLEKRYYRSPPANSHNINEAIEATATGKAESAVDYEQRNANPDTFKSTILLIDPLPDTAKSNQFAKTDLRSLVPQLLKLLMNQARFKPELIEEAVDTNDFSKFIIAPRRQGKDKKRINGYRALASGSLGAFAGFLRKDFLMHDFYLGRRNCQSFLQHHFVVEDNTDNPIFTEGYANAAVRERFRYKKGEKHYLPIIPDMKYVSHFGSFDGLNAEERRRLNVEEIMDYGQLPKVDDDTLRQWRKLIRKRLRVAMKSLANNEGKSGQKDYPVTPVLNVLERWLLGAYVYVFKVRKIAIALTDIIRNELRDVGLFH